MRIKLLPLVVSAVVVVGCDDPGFIMVEPGFASANYAGTWTGIEEITVGEDIGFNLGPNDRGFNFPVVLQLFGDGKFTLITSNFPTSYDNEAARQCTGLYVVGNVNIQFYPNQTCRALPLPKYTIGRVLPLGINLDATTATSATSTPATIKVKLRLTRA